MDIASDNKIKTLRAEIHEYVRIMQGQGHTVAPGGQYDPGWGSVCLVGAILHGSGHGKETELYAAVVLDITSYELRALEHGFEGWTFDAHSLRECAPYHELGKEFRWQLLQNQSPGAD